MWTAVHFKSEEFDSPDAPGSGKLMVQAFINKLDVTRDLFGEAMKVVSGYRTVTHNAAVGGAQASDHTLGEAADVECNGMDKNRRYRLVAAAVAAGMRQIAVGDRIVHLANDPSRPQMFGIYHPGERGMWF